MAAEQLTDLAKPKEFDPVDEIRLILPRRHVIHGSADTRDVRIIRILESRDCSETAPLLGFGADGTAERALCRAVLTYAMREHDGLEHITVTHYPAAEQISIVPGASQSLFDQIVWDGDLKIYQEGDEVVAWSPYSDGGRAFRPSEGRGPGPLTAVEALTKAWLGFNVARFAGIPPILFQ